MFTIYIQRNGLIGLEWVAVASGIDESEVELLVDVLTKCGVTHRVERAE